MKPELGMAPVALAKNGHMSGPQLTTNLTSLSCQVLLT